MKVDRYGTGVLSKDIPEEKTRLELLQRALDPLSIKAIESVPNVVTPECLDLGAGGGSISYWLSSRFPEGHVVAADIDPRYLNASRSENLTVLAFDMREDDLSHESFDLIHTRSVLKHLPERDEIISKIFNWLKPGGWAVLVDGYWFPSDDTAHPVWAKPMDAIVRQMNSQGGDMRWTRTLPRVIARAGFVNLEITLSPSLGGWSGWGGQNHEWIKPTIKQTASVLVDKGYLSAEDVSDFLSQRDSSEMAEWFGIVAAIRCQRPKE